ncbi:hypothetical protein [Kitasatospora sp. LaBMicrA B282]|uniref:hypothetical protein n=1 Tax=Kitasatospora sp. LaBMicrA B282 TaxID=3420949 RepID=UPI003D105D66
MSIGNRIQSPAGRPDGQPERGIHDSPSTRARHHCEQFDAELWAAEDRLNWDYDVGYDQDHEMGCP